MAKCIFCLTANINKFNTKEHILPESIGGEDWALLPEGLFCDECQNIFGSSIEQQALADYPFVNLRTLLSIPTKKRKSPWFNYPEGTLYAGGEPGKIIYQPNKFFKRAFESGQKTMTILPAITKKPEMVLRMLLKIGLEVIAANDKDTVFEDRFNPTREFALLGNKKHPWFYIQKKDWQLFPLYVKGIDWKDNHIFMDVFHENNGLVKLHMRLYYMEFLVPLIGNVYLPDIHEFKSSEYKVIFV